MKAPFGISVDRAIAFLASALPRIALACFSYIICAGAVGLVVFGCMQITNPDPTGEDPSETASAAVNAVLDVDPGAVPLVSPQTTATLTWNLVPDGYTACQADDDWAGTTIMETQNVGTASLTGGVTITPTQAGVNSYVFKCTDSSNVNYYPSISLTVYTPPVLALAANPIALGQSATLTWGSDNATLCTATGTAPAGAMNPWSGPVSPLAGGSLTFTPTLAGQYGFQMTCIEQVDPTKLSAQGTSATPVTLTVNSAAPPIMVSLTISPSTVDVNQPATASWNSSNAATCTASGSPGTWTGPEPTNGTLAVSQAAAGTYSYTLTCVDSTGTVSASSTAILTVPPAPTVTIAFTPTTVAAGGTATLAWTSTNTTGECIASGAWGPDEPLSGSISVTPPTAATYPYTLTYTLTCSGPGGSISANATLTVTAPLTSIAVSPTTASVAVAGVQPYTVTGTYADGTQQTLTAQASWTSSNTAFATITSPGGVATGVAAGGPVTITATVTSNGQTFTATASLTVTGASTILPCNPAPGSPGGGPDLWDNESFCVSFSGETDQGYQFSGILTFTTQQSGGPVLSCQTASTGVLVFNNNAPSSVGPIGCSGLTEPGVSNLLISDPSGNQFQITFNVSNGTVVTISGKFEFGAYGYGGGLAVGPLTGVED